MKTHREESMLLLGSGAGDANFNTPAAVGLPTEDVRRYVSNYLSPDILIDFNDHTTAALDTFGVDGRAIRHLFVTHGHYDHFQPLEILHFAAGLPSPLAVYGNSMTRDALEFCRHNVFDHESGRFVAHQSPFNIEMNVITPGMAIAVGETKVTAVLGNHFMHKQYSIMEQQALNFVIEEKERTIFYGLDSSYLLPETLKLLSRFRFDLAILDATFGPREIDPAVSGHLNWKMLDETIAEFRAAGCIDDATVIVADHISTDSVEPYHEIVDELSARGITLAYDGQKL